MNPRRPVFFVAMALIMLAVGLWFFSNGVRTVNVVGLFASGAACGAAFAGFLVSMRRMKRPA
ncbi:MAG TPA: hypothetical protein VFX04_08815 [Rhodanobacteraceae bacterium]|jgi:hypothetical protein|nr:hypothetical protein [Rhodanobacteraceae bacterium]